ncbi:GTP-binding protein [Colwellia sp. PAMC 20917]|uniref:YdcH family protein n=1 Tax=unclassified Colwellia TaxID=196834 RepID=UPI0008789F21|nr:MULTISPECIES: YdcH family protein [unclassified Colwellia]AOW77371.1 GTP-binding protein [Colwellia sp. PAMC 20917]MBA6347916.1 YdcH family protein [Colwellia sp. BRX8-9]MBA6351909.1 YdcH family protein [Colwellia sp. BRX9-1]MBA6355222.1 YdcH family protein [Colwellia sp. BRX8-3]MBA6358854.1 YdcH family protein [Colwellia sp. BRX8-6]|tara:strand:- start:467 stop:718 length:252 start_codon:yes stop_codon:yes gene_type:complete
MIIEKHDLHHEFPEFADEIRSLKMNDAHFARLFKKYHELDQEVHHIEQGAENTSDEYLDQQKKQRLHLKDELFTIIKKAKLTT